MQEYAIENPSSTENGVEVEITAAGIVRIPILRNITNNQTLKLGRPNLPLVMQPRDVLKINTQARFVSATLNGVDILQRYLTINSDMVQVEPGRNVLKFDADEGGNLASCRIRFRGKILAL